MAREKIPATQAVRVLREHGVDYTDHPYAYEDRGGTAVSARELGVGRARRDQDARHGRRSQAADDRAHAWRSRSVDELARILGVKHVAPYDPAVADRHSGYQVGGTSPFGTRKAMPVYAERSIAELPYLYVNGGRRGYLVGMPARELMRVLKPVLVDVAVPQLAP